MAKAKQHEKKQSKNKQRDNTTTPQPNDQPIIPVIGSSCTWRASELDHFNVDLDTDIDVHGMIPPQFFAFDHLDGYKECNSLD